MRLVHWVDEKGWHRASLVRDSDPDDMAPQGIGKDPPRLDDLTWQDCMKEIHNKLVDMEIFSLDDVQRHQDAVGNVVGGVIRRKIIELFKLLEQEVK